MSNPQVSICLPVYNGAKHLSAAIESALSQTFGDFELLIADDGSSDGSAEIANSFQKQDRRVRYWKNEQRQGLFGNYNACIKQAQGKFIKTFAQDDIFHSNALEEMVNLLNREPNVALVSSSREIIDDNGEVSEFKQPIKTNFRARGKDVITFHLIALNNWVGEPSTVMFRREYAGSGFDNAYYHYGDIEYWFRILENGDFYYFEKALTQFRRHAASQTDKNHRELLFALDILRMSSKYRHLLADFEPEELFKRRISEKIALEHGHVLSAAEPENLFEMYEKIFLATENKQVASNYSELELQRLKAEAAGFRLLASMSLTTISKLIEELDHEKRCRVIEHDRFVEEVNKMQSSIYWKLSSPLRNLKKALKGSSDS